MYKGTINRVDAMRQGFMIDTTCYPNVAYKGPRFDPTEWAEIPTTDAPFMAFEDMEVGTVYSVRADSTKFMKLKPEEGHSISMITGHIEKVDLNPGTHYLIHEIIVEPYYTFRVEELKEEYRIGHMTHHPSYVIEAVKEMLYPDMDVVDVAIQLGQMSRKEVLKAWLEYEGIIGFADQIWEIATGESNG